MINEKKDLDKYKQRKECGWRAHRQKIKDVMG
jgi:hypothetical protein